ncbi:MAG: amidohydrolase [Oscillospiraceae bacterium]|nr:amidohydrolase [Oscillospiraceae bacterium]
MLIINGTLHPMDGPVIESGFVAFEEGKITAIGPMSEAPAPDEVLDAAGGHVLPGFVDAHCHLGLLGDGLGFEADDCNEGTDPATPHLRAIDGVNPFDRGFEEARAGGVTTVVTGPGSANPVAGQIAALKTAGRWVDDMVLAAPLAMKFALGENPKTSYNERHETPVTRMATAAIMREHLAKAQEYLKKKTLALNDEDLDEPEFDPKLEALIPLLKGRIAAHFHAHRADDIATAVRVAREFDLRFVIVHGTEGHRVADILAREGAAVIAGPIIGDRCKPELVHQTVENAALLAAAGVKVAICTDHPENPIQYLPLAAALTVRAGLDPETALAAITRTPAELCGLEDRIGTLTPGKDADIVIWDRHPFEVSAKAQAVFIDGIRHI